MAVTTILQGFGRAIVETVNSILSPILNAIRFLISVNVEVINVLLEIFAALVDFVLDHIFLTITMLALAYWLLRRKERIGSSPVAIAEEKRE